MSDFNCPYCGAPFSVCNDDGHGYAEDVCHQDQCLSCEKHFVFTTAISFHYTPHKAECLNDGEHDWAPVLTTPVEFSTMRCRACDETRKPNAEEWKELLARGSATLSCGAPE